jgi:hypothetical protein
MIWGRGVPMPLVGGGNVGTLGGIRREGRRVMFYETESGVEEGGIRREGRRSKFLLMLF